MIKFLANRTKVFYIVVFTFLSVLIFTAGIIFYQSRQADIKKQKYVELSAIAELKINQIASWRKQKFSDASQIARSEVLKKEINSYFINPTANSMIRNWIRDYKTEKDYSQIFLLDLNFKSTIPGSDFTAPANVDLAKILKEQKPVFSDLTLAYDGKSIFADIYIPLLLKQPVGLKPLGMMVFRIDPEKFLFPVIQLWPTPSKTSETLILRIEKDSILYLNKLRFQNIKPFGLRRPLNDPTIAGVMAATGRRGVVEGMDYRGEPVLADLRTLPDTEWLVITKTDLVEVFAPLSDLYYSVFWVGVLLVLATGAGVGMVWRHQHAEFYKKLYVIEREKRAISKQFEYLTKYANDIILFLDITGKITYANDCAAITYGYSVDELQEMNIKDIRINDESPDLDEVFRQAEEESGVVYQAVHKAKDGKIIYVESSARLLEVDGSKFFQSIIRNITEKRKIDNQIKLALEEKEILLKEVHHRVKNNLQTIISLLSLQAGFLNDENVLKIFRDSQSRIKSMALLHQQLYTQDFGSVDSLHYFEKLIYDLIRSYKVSRKAVEVVQDIDSKMLSIDVATSLGLLITEIISNILKHAFPGERSGIINFSFKEINPRDFILIISDNGIGLPKVHSAENSPTLGIKLINNLVKQLSGTIKVDGNCGTSYIINFSDCQE